MEKIKIYYYNDKGVKILLKYNNNNEWQIDKYYNINKFYIIEDKGIYSNISKLAECSKDSQLIKITKELRNQHLIYSNNSFKFKDGYNVIDKPIVQPKPFNKYDFNLPERTDNQIRLIYYGSLNDKENILEIINQFKNIHINYQNIILSIVYNKIYGNDDFKYRINQYINKGVDGITFLYNLNYQEVSYHIARSDIGISLQNNNSKASNIPIEYNKYKLFIINNIENIKNPILYIVSSTGPYISNGYIERTHYLTNSINNIIIALNPIKDNNKNYITNTNIIHRNKIILLYNIKYIIKLIKLLNIKLIIIPSDQFNFLTMYSRLKHINNLKFIYEIRGLWYATGIAKALYLNKEIPSHISKHYKNELKSLNLADGIIYITEEVKTYLSTQSTFNLLDKPNIVINNGCDIKQQFNYKCNDSTGVFVIGYCGSIVEYEGIDILIKVCQILNNENIKVKLKLVGNNTMNININKHFIEYTKWIDNNLLNEFYNQIHLFCIPRLDYLVTNIISPLKPYNILMNKIPLLMSNCDVLKNISDNGKNCMLFKKNDLNDLKEKIIDIINNGYNNKILENGYNYVIQNKQWGMLSDKFYKFIKSV